MKMARAISLWLPLLERILADALFKFCWSRTSFIKFTHLPGSWEFVFAASACVPFAGVLEGFTLVPLRKGQSQLDFLTRFAHEIQVH